MIRYYVLASQIIRDTHLPLRPRWISRYFLGKHVLHIIISKSVSLIFITLSFIIIVDDFIKTMSANVFSYGHSTDLINILIDDISILLTMGHMYSHFINVIFNNHSLMNSAPKLKLGLIRR